MDRKVNPFQQSYFSDDTQTETAFVELFSSEVLQTAIHPVFQEGNVVLSGPQGCGKTMVLSLLRPEIRIAYHKLAREFPIHEKMRNFISAGVNLTRSRLTDIVQISLNRGEDVDQQELPKYFGDFFNFWVVQDLLNSMEVLASHPEVFASTVNLKNADDFAKSFAQKDCWYGALEGVTNLESLKRRLSDRITFYRKWVNGNLARDGILNAISSSKTDIGEPIAQTAECLRDFQIVGKNVPILIRIDQIEELHRAFMDRQRLLLLSMRKMLNRVFAARDARVHYRAGTRPYGWSNPEFMGIAGSEAKLENRRDYHMVNMDTELFAQGEAKNSIFERFAIDAFQKRIRYYFGTEIASAYPQMAKSVFGKSPTAEMRISQLNPEADEKQIDRALGIDSAMDGGNWTGEWRTFLRKLYKNGYPGMLDAVLAAAWGRQTGGANSKKQHRASPPPPNFPWRERKWWRKERLDQAVLQLMARCQQRFMWWGFEDIRSLSGGNISVFIHICHRVWDAFLKNESSLPDDRQTNLFNGQSIKKEIQAAGILFASTEWFDKLPEEPGGDSRKSFVHQLGIRLNSDMTKDLKMSYPGGNGISVSIAEYSSLDEATTSLRNFVDEAVGYGALFKTEHSSKRKSEGHRVKFYLNPIFSPRFQLPEARTKEPYYWSMKELSDLAQKAQITLSKVKRHHLEMDRTLPLFPDN